ncbi:EAL domain-containing protein (plasmid) [Desulfosporosinus acidiphilus SJ4]|jgi:EAL domain-containing protein (putative c-di-GMP-specific phosphodiesterase class I)|uniref:EAL domain-containing protein n=1 Tax=Desulfosporosinus acidiphilus (strain DSM 22704 / JCM 16185 / SJ4) TaxID=646529 RepID=I4DCU8_DESAJ|nr:EAL domain-containing protein [Desulfosporosinus acidiphilus]AFM43622.1 EAL domain-containing protein [Desulfosporosinus acidiphilus SJ4]
MIFINLAASIDPLESALFDILEDKIATKLAIQPIIKLSDMSVFGYEVLSRWDEFAPDQIFRTAERFGTVGQLERLILSKVLDVLDVVPYPLFINVHPSIPNPKDWRELPKDKVVLEITEDAAIRFPAVQSLRDFGFALALDDLGKGSANLEALALIQPDYIKLDKSLIQSPNLMARNSLIKSLIDHAGRVKANLIVEGIESAEHLLSVKTLGVSLAQGYYLAKPELLY